MTEPILHAKNIKKTVVNDNLFEKKVSKTLWSIPELLVTEPGFYVIAGRNGAGKSTLLRCLLYLLTPDTGTITWYGKHHIDAHVIGYLPEFPIIPPSAKVHHWLSWLLDKPRKALENQEGHLSRFPSLAIRHLLDIPANRLSKGQQQRVQLWACLANNPKGVILDEPFSGLDPWARVELANLLCALLDDGLFIFMSTHELPQSLRQRTRETWVIENESVSIHQGCTLPQ